MIQEHYILVSEFCTHHHLEVTFIQRLEQRGMVVISRMEEDDYLPSSTIAHLERMVRLYQELEIHPDDLDIVADLMERISKLQTELEIIRRQLAFSEQIK